jgi:hypothetical protein
MFASLVAFILIDLWFAPFPGICGILMTAIDLLIIPPDDEDPHG